MGCSSSTLTRSKEAKRPPAKAAGTKGPKKNGVIDDVNTIPTQAKLVPLTQNVPPEKDQVKVKETAELGEAKMAPTTDDNSEAVLPANQEPAQAEQPPEVITSQDCSVVKGEEAPEANKQEEIVKEEPETKENEMEHSVDAAEPKIDTANVEE